MRSVKETSTVFDLLQLREVAKPTEEKKNVFSYLWQTKVGVNVLCLSPNRMKQNNHNKRPSYAQKKFATYEEHVHVKKKNAHGNIFDVTSRKTLQVFSL